MAFVSNDEINAIRAKADIISIVGSYIPLTQRGKNYFCVCPFHDDHSPSMSLSTDKQIYKCFSCGATGNVFSFVAEYENVSFIEAVSIVANKCGMELSQATYNSNVSQVFKEEYEIMELSQKFFLNNLRTDVGKEATKYLNDRGITDDIIKEFGIGLSLDSNDSLLTLLNKKNYDTDKLVDIGLVNNVNGKTYDMFNRRITFPLWDKDENIVVRDLTTEEAEALNKGDITEEEAINILTGKKEDVANSGGVDNSSSFEKKEPENNTNEASKKVSEAIAKLYIQKNTYLSKLDVIEEEARTKYLSMKEMEPQDRKSTLLSEYLPKVGQWEKDCDNVVYGIIDEIKIALKEAGQPDNITEKLKKAYLDEKSAKKTYFINRYMD